MNSTTIYQWLSKDSVSKSKKILTEYPGMNDLFAQNFLKWTKGQLAKSAASALRTYKVGECSDGAFFKVVDGKKIFSSLSEVEMQFINSLFLIESSYCLTDTNLQEAYEVYMSPEFRMDVMPRVKDFTLTNNGYCISSEGIPGLILPAYQCSRSQIKQSDNTILVHNTLESRKMGPKFQPLHYREEVILFVSIPNGVALYRGTFTRSVEIGMTSKYILSSTVESSQNDIRTQYQEWLRKK